MAWTDGKVMRLRALWGGMFSAEAIAIAFGMTRNAVLGKIYRLRAADDAQVQLADVARAIWAQAGNTFHDADKMRALMAVPGFVLGLADGEVRPEFLETEENRAG